MKTRAKAGEAPTKALEETLRGTRVLVADDNATSGRILQRMLCQWQLNATAVTSGETALEELRSARDAGTPYALVIVDSRMPVMDGFALVERIRQNSSALTVMMLTPATYVRDAERCRKLGLTSYLTKPIRRLELRDSIARSLGAAIRAKVGSAPQGLRKRTKVRLQILVAEDNPVNQKLAVRLLEKEGHRPVVVATGLQALKALENDTYDVVLMDVHMPEMDGLEATTRIRQKETGSGKHQLVFGLTAAAMKGDEEMCLAAGMDCYLTKPLRPQELLELLELHATSNHATDQEGFSETLGIENLAVTTRMKSPQVESGHMESKRT